MRSFWPASVLSGHLCGATEKNMKIFEITILYMSYFCEGIL
jgi:hypothetical protein